jgi:putative transposase
MFAAEIRKRRIQKLRAHSNWQWHLDEVFVKINGETHYLWRAVDHEGEVLESYVTKRCDRKAALKFLRKTLKRFRQIRCLQKFVSVHASVHNHFNQERHLYSRANFKLNGTAALAEWRLLCSE